MLYNVYEETSEMSMRFCQKMLVQICIGIAIGCIGVNIYDGNWMVLPGWIAGLFWAIGWRMEISESEFQRREAHYWKNMWMQSRTVDLGNGFGKTETRTKYVTQEEIDEMKKRILEFDFTKSKEKKEELK